MVDINGAIAATIVRRRGASRAGIGMAVGGVTGAAIATRRARGTTPLTDQFGFVAVLADRILLLKARGALKSRPTDVVLGEASRTHATADFSSNKSWGVLELTFGDGTFWEFDVPRAGLRDAERVAEVVGQADAVNTSNGSLPRGHD